MMGDFKAQLGSNNNECKQIMGRHGLGTLNDNGDRLVELCDRQHHLPLPDDTQIHLDIATWTKEPDRSRMHQRKMAQFPSGRTQQKRRRPVHRP